MNYKFFLCTSLLIFNPLSADEPNSVKPFMYGTAFGIAGVGIFIATRGKMKTPSRRLFTLPWNRHKQELQELSAKLEQLARQHASHTDNLTEIKTGIAAQNNQLNTHSKQLEEILSTTVKTAYQVKTIQKQTKKIEAHTQALYGAMHETVRVLQAHSGPISNFLTWLSPKGSITPTPRKDLPKISTNHPKNNL